MNSKFAPKNFIAAILIIIFSIFFGAENIRAQVESDIDINAKVPGCLFDFNIRPEKRIPSVDHWRNQYEITFYKSSSGLFYYQFNLATDQYGVAQVDLCSENLDFDPTNYEVVVKGFSHLTRKYSNQLLFSNHITTLDYSSVNLQLAGDLNEDDIVNLSDLEIIENDIYGSTIKNDLNRDGIVNSLDISNLIFNFENEGEE